MTAVHEILLGIVSDEEKKTGGVFGKYRRGGETGVGGNTNSSFTAMVPCDDIYYSSNEYVSSHTVEHNYLRMKEGR